MTINVLLLRCEAGLVGQATDLVFLYLDEGMRGAIIEV